jgi:K+-sensing histidine kinase KdpD
MIHKGKLGSNSPPNEEQFKKNQSLHQDQLSAKDKFLWKTMVDTSQRLQVTTSSIKAAVTSLLMYDIFWDEANQHEFLATINTSVDQVSELVKLIVLSSRIQAGELDLKCEPHLLQEILSVLRIEISKRYPNLLGNVNFPVDGKLVKVDYEYFKFALEMLLSLFNIKPDGKKIIIDVEEKTDCWLVKLKGVDPIITKMIHLVTQCVTKPQTSKKMSAENILQLHIVCEIMQFQKIKIEVSEKFEVITLVVPSYGE